MRSGERALGAAAVLRECRDAFAARGTSVIREAAGLDPMAVATWRHYPEGEAYDPQTHAQYFYHRHAKTRGAASGTAGEHGHFHLFLRGEGVPAGIAPLLLPELAVANAPMRQSAPLKHGSRDEVCHLVAIDIDAHGEALRLFTTNRWVTGETWYRAEDVVRMLDRFALATDQPSAVLNRWLAALVRLYQPEIADLLHRRDKTILERRWRQRRGNVFEDEGLEVTSALDIDVAARLAELDRTPSPAAATAVRSQRTLPRMAEGWGA